MIFHKITNWHFEHLMFFKRWVDPPGSTRNEPPCLSTFFLDFPWAILSTSRYFWATSDWWVKNMWVKSLIIPKMIENNTCLKPAIRSFIGWYLKSIFVTFTSDTIATTTSLSSRFETSFLLSIEPWSWDILRCSHAVFECYSNLPYHATKTSDFCLHHGFYSSPLRFGTEKINSGSDHCGFACSGGGFCSAVAVLSS